MSVTCPECGAENRDDAKFCRGCGFSLKGVARPPGAPAVPVSPTALADTVPAALDERPSAERTDFDPTEPAPASNGAAAATSLPASGPAWASSDPVPAPSGRWRVGGWAALAGGVIVVMALAVWSGRGERAHSASPAVPAATAAATPAVASAVAPAPAPVATPVATSLPAQGSAATAGDANPGAAPAVPSSPSAPVVAPTAAVPARPKADPVPSRAPVAKSDTTPKARAEARPEPSRAPSAAREPEPTTAVASVAGAAPAARAEPLPELCPGKNFFMAIVCLKQECTKPAHAQHPKCVDFLEKERRREERDALYR